MEGKCSVSTGLHLGIWGCVRAIRRQKMQALHYNNLYLAENNMSSCWLGQVFLGWFSLLCLGWASWENVKEHFILFLSFFCTSSIPFMSLRLWQFVKISSSLCMLMRVENLCFTSPDKLFANQGECMHNTIQTTFSWPSSMSKLKEKAVEPPPGFHNDKHCVGSKAQSNVLTTSFLEPRHSFLPSQPWSALGLGGWLQFLLGCSRHQSRHQPGAVQW